MDRAVVVGDLLEHRDSKDSIIAVALEVRIFEVVLNELDSSSEGTVDSSEFL